MRMQSLNGGMCSGQSTSNQEYYYATKKIGRGKYSEVFEGIDSRTDKKIIIKVLKPVKKRKIKREIQILKVLRGGINIIDVTDVVRDPESKTPSLVILHIELDI